jgi:thiol-disulfide isomerase/thioredoxin
MNKQKNTTLIIALVLIIGIIWYIETQKPPVPETATGSSLVSSMSTSSADYSTRVADKAAKYPQAKELAGITGYINSDSFKLADLVGKKVILLDFWTYSCINCLRTLPYVESWAEKYKAAGLVVIGVHTPEFDFEKDYGNVSAAVKRLGVTYPVVLDSNMATWNTYENNYWPREYLIDIDGFIVHDEIGEGNYDETEKAIQAALAERAHVLGLSASSTLASTTATGMSNPSKVIPINPHEVLTPETYFGSARNEYLVGGVMSPDSPLKLNGKWDFQDQYAESTSLTAEIIYPYNSKNVYLVASSKNGVTLKILKDGKPLSPAEYGKDVSSDGTVRIKENRLYDLIDGLDYGQHTIDIKVEGAGLDVFTFTFG